MSSETISTVIVIALAGVVVLLLIFGLVSMWKEPAAATGEADEHARRQAVAAAANSAPFDSPIQPDPGMTIIGAARVAQFAGRAGEHVQVAELVHQFIDDAKRERYGALQWSTDRCPATWGDQLDVAVGLKRAGEFLASVQTYLGLFREHGVIYTGVLDILYKAVACSGALGAASDLLEFGQTVFMSDPRSEDTLRQWGGPSMFEERRVDLTAAAVSAEALEAYLRSISGNTNYVMPRDYSSAIAELGSRT